MNLNNILRDLLLVMLFPLFGTSCHQSISTGKENGWYYILDKRKDSISSEPIVTVKDFVALNLDSGEISGRSFYEITGKLSKYKLNKWADATEKAVGKRIGFIFNNEVITCPQVNMRLESGRFSISNPAYDIKELFNQIRKEKVDSIEHLFKGWDRDSLFYTLPQHEIDSIMMEMDYWQAREWKDLVTNPLDHYWYGNLDTVEYNTLEKALQEELQKPNASSHPEYYMKSAAFLNYKTYLYEHPDYINLMFQGFLFKESPKGLYGHLIDNIIKNKYPQAPSLREFVEKTDNRDDELLAVHQWQKRIWRLMNEERKSASLTTLSGEYDSAG